MIIPIIKVFYSTILFIKVFQSTLCILSVDINGNQQYKVRGSFIIPNVYDQIIYNFLGIGSHTNIHPNFYLLLILNIVKYKFSKSYFLAKTSTFFREVSITTEESPNIKIYLILLFFPLILIFNTHFQLIHCIYNLIIDIYCE